MPERDNRWRRLAIFAAINLAIWLVVAVIVGLLASDRIDVGGEYMIRVWRATAVARLQAPRRTATPWAVAPATTQSAGPVATDTAPTGGLDAPTAISSQGESTPGPQRTPLPGTPSSPQPTQPPEQEQAASTQTADAATSTAESAEAAGATLPPSPTPVSGLLLLPNPGFANLAGLEAELERSAEGRRVFLWYNEETLNHEIEALVRDNPDLPYDNVQVDLELDEVIVSGEAMVMGFKIGAEIVGAVVAEDCVPRMETREIALAGVLTPGFVKSAIAGMLEDALDWYPDDYPLCLDEILVEKDRVTVFGHRR